MEHLGQFILHHWLLWVMLVVILLITFVNEYKIRTKNATTVTPQAAIELMNHDSAVVIDLRDAEAFSNGHIINAIRANVDEFERQHMAKYKNIPIILVCSTGTQSAQIAIKLREKGFIKLFVLAGGVTAWQNLNLPIVKGMK